MDDMPNLPDVFGRSFLTPAFKLFLIGVLSAYVARVQASVVKGAAMLAVFLVLYGFLYLLLRLEDYALLAGAILGFILLTAVMFATLKVNWSGRAAGARPLPAEPGDPA
jgi:inner membrane protein